MVETREPVFIKVKQTCKTFKKKCMSRNVLASSQFRPRRFTGGNSKAIMTCLLLVLFFILDQGCGISPSMGLFDFFISKIEREVTRNTLYKFKHR